MVDPVRIANFYAPFDTESVISQLRAAREVELRTLDTQSAAATAKKVSLATLQTRFSSLLARLSAITSAQSVTGKTATSSDTTKVSAAAAPSAVAGSFTVDVVALATGTTA